MQKALTTRIIYTNRRFFVFLLITIFLFLSVKYKQNNLPSIKPLYTFGLLIIGFFCISNLISYISSKKVNLLVFSQLPVYIFALLIINFGFSSMLASERALKDFIYFLYWITILPLFLITYINHKYDTTEFLFLVCKAVLIFSVVTSIVAILTFFGITEFEYGSYVLKQNIWTIGRIHGYMGEPTALGGLIGFSIIAFYFIRATENIKYRLTTPFLLYFSLIASGSRNAVISLLVVGLFAFFIDLRKSLLLKLLILLCILASTLIVFQLIELDLPFTFFNRGELSNSNSNRLFVWANLLSMYAKGDVVNLLFGFGVEHFSQATGGAAFNASLEILYAYGLINFVLYQMLFLTSFYIGIKRYKLTKSLVYKYGLMFLIFGYCFSLFMSFFPSTDFHFAPFAFIFGILIICIPIQNLKLNESKSLG